MHLTISSSRIQFSNVQKDALLVECPAGSRMLLWGEEIAPHGYGPTAGPWWKLEQEAARLNASALLFEVPPPEGLRLSLYPMGSHWPVRMRAQFIDGAWYTWRENDNILKMRRIRQDAATKCVAALSEMRKTRELYLADDPALPEDLIRAMDVCLNALGLATYVIADGPANRSVSEVVINPNAPIRDYHERTFGGYSGMEIDDADLGKLDYLFQAPPKPVPSTRTESTPPPTVYERLGRERPSESRPENTQDGGTDPTS